MMKSKLLKKIFEIPEFVRELDLEELLFIKRFGIPEKKAKFLHLRKNNFADFPAPVFFLSTGRCGTNWFTHLLNKSQTLRAFHEPKPNLGIQGVMLYEYLKKNDFSIDKYSLDIFKEIIYIAREQYFRYSFKTNHRYVETNNHITFFAPVLEAIFPTAQFIHIYRHPGDFVRSAVRRKFYSDNNVDDLKRIKPIKGTSEYQKWDTFSSLEKSSWLWNETNTFIEDFKKRAGKEKCYSFNFTGFNIKDVEELLEFLKIHIPRNTISRKLPQRTNEQKKEHFPLYKNWKDSDKVILKKHCGKLAGKYGYRL